MTTSLEVTWTAVVAIPLQTAPLTTDPRLQEILESVALGVAQAARGEGRALEERDFPTDDD